MTEPWRARISEPLRGVAAYTVPRPAAAGVRAKLDANESPYPLPADVAADIAAAIARADLHRYPDPACSELRAVVAADIGVPEGRLVFGHGSNELILHLCLAFGAPPAGSPRPRVLYPVPSFVYYRSAALAAGAEPIEVPLGAGFALDADAIADGIARHDPNLVFFARPNNPTGTLWDRTAIEALVAAHPATLFVVDEAYVEFSGDSLIDRLADAPNLIVLRTYSKVGLAGLRVGALAASEAVVAEVGKVVPPYNLGVPNQIAATRLLSRHRALLAERAAAVAAERERLRTALSQLDGVFTFPSAGNMVLVELVAPDAAWRALADRGVLVRRFPGHPLLDPYLRITVGTAADTDAVVDALRAAIAHQR